MADNSRSQTVSLGCGTLILIALIVLIFSNRGVDDLEREIKQMHTEIGALKQSVDAQTKQIQLLRDELGHEAPKDDHEAEPEDGQNP
jgi:cell division protein FtsB